MRIAARLAQRCCDEQQLSISSSHSSTFLKPGFCYNQDQFINLVVKLGGRITEANPAAGRLRYLDFKTLLNKYDTMINRSFTPFPVLTTERLTLRQLSTDDGQDILALRSDTEINKYLDRQASTTIEDAISFINKINNNIEKNISVYWAITLTNSKHFVGTICLFDFSNEKNKCEIGYELLTNFQGQGIMKEATENVTVYAFQTMRLQKIEAFTHTDNRNSIKLLTKCGFEKSIEVDKKIYNYTIFVLTNSLNSM